MKIKVALLIMIMVPVLVQAQTGKWEIIDSLKFIQPGHQYPWEMKYIKIEKRGNTICAFGNMSSQYPWNRVSWDNGKTWTSTLMDSARYNHEDYYIPPVIYDATFINENLSLVACDSGYYFISYDNLKTWNKKKLDNEFGLYKVSFYNSEYGLLLTWKQFYYSFDGGKNWILKKIIAPDSSNKFQILDILILNQNKIIILNYDYDKKIRFTSITSDFGDTWEYYYLDTLKFQKMFFLDEMTGWGCGGHQIIPDSPTQKDVIVHTTDGGKTWQKQLDTLVIPSMGLNQIYFIDRENGFAHGLGRKLWRTTNGGKKWTMDTSVNIRNIPWPTIDIAPVSHDLIFACSEYIGLMYKYSETVSVDPENKDKNSKQEFSISPNPAGDYIEIAFSSPRLKPWVAGVDAIKIFNLLGECVFSVAQTFPSVKIGQTGMSDLLRIDVSGLPPGIYFVRAGDWVGRFVKSGL